jgi:PAS domain S-box-containing protein
MDRLDCHTFFNFLVDERAGRLHLNACAGIPEEETRKIEWLDYGAAICGCVARDGSRIIAEHIPTIPDERTDLIKSYGIKAYACHPLLGPGGKVIGTLSFGTRGRETFSEEDLSLMKAVTDQVAAAMTRMTNELALRESEERFRLLVENVRDYAIFMLDPEGRVVTWNEGAERLKGYKPEEIVGQQFSLFYPAEDVASGKPQHELEAAIAAGQSEEEGWRVRKDGSRFWASAVITALRDKGGALLGFTEVTRDITERKKAEEEIKRHIAILNGINTIFKEALTSDTDEELARACLRVAEEITGSKFGFIGEVAPDGLLHDTAISDPGWELCTMYDKTGHRRPPGDFKLHGIYGRVILDGKGFFTNDPATHPDRIGTPGGHPPLMAFLGVPLISGGNTIGMVAVGNREGGYRQEELEALEALAPAIVEALHRVRADEALRQSENRLNRSQEIAHLGSWELDLVNNHLTWSDEVYRLFGLQPQEFGATYEAFLEVVHPDDRTAVNEAYSSSLREGRDAYEIEHRVVRKATGEIRYVHEKCEHFRDETGKIIRSVGMVHDITERKKAEDDVLKLSEDMAARNLELEAANKELETFSYSVSHDLRAPLRSIDGFSRALLDDYNDRLDAEGRDFLERILSATQKMGHLIDDLLNLSRVSRTEMRREKVDLSEMAVRIAEGLKQAHPERGVEFIIAEGLSAYGDERLLNIVVENLIGNAWKFTENRSDAVIEFGELNCGMRNADCGFDKNSEIRDRKSEMVYFVKDNGAGFDMTYADKLFAPFQRLHKPAEFAGTGIGLATVKRIINRHGGHVWIEGDKDKGATVYFYSSVK